MQVKQRVRPNLRRVLLLAPNPLDDRHEAVHFMNQDQVLRDLTHLRDIQRVRTLLICLGKVLEILDGHELGEREHLGVADDPARGLHVLLGVHKDALQFVREVSDQFLRAQVVNVGSRRVLQHQVVCWQVGLHHNRILDAVLGIWFKFHGQGLQCAQGVEAH